MGVFPNENATARNSRDTQQQGKCSNTLTLQHKPHTEPASPLPGSSLPSPHPTAAASLRSCPSASIPACLSAAIASPADPSCCTETPPPANHTSPPAAAAPMPQRSGRHGSASHSGPCAQSHCYAAAPPSARTTPPTTALPPCHPHLSGL